MYGFLRIIFLWCSREIFPIPIWWKNQCELVHYHVLKKNPKQKQNVHWLALHHPFFVSKHGLNTTQVNFSLWFCTRRFHFLSSLQHYQVEKKLLLLFLFPLLLVLLYSYSSCSSFSSSCVSFYFSIFSLNVTSSFPFM